MAKRIVFIYRGNPLILICVSFVVFFFDFFHSTRYDTFGECISFPFDFLDLNICICCVSLSHSHSLCSARSLLMCVHLLRDSSCVIYVRMQCCKWKNRVLQQIFRSRFFRFYFVSCGADVCCIYGQTRCCYFHLCETMQSVDSHK